MKSAKPLTDYSVKTLRPTREQQGWRDIQDGGCRGLMLRVSPRGEKVWAARLTVNGHRSFKTFGAYPAVTLAEARQRVEDFLAAARDGSSPDTVEARKRAETMTLREAHKEYIEALRSELRSRTVTLKEGMFRDHVGPIAGNRLVRQIRRADVVEVVEGVRRKGLGTQANRVFSEIMALLRWCEAREWIDGVPSVRRKSVGERERPRDRTLTDEEIRHLWAAAAVIGDLSGAFLRLLLLTGQRRDDVRLMAWEEIDLANGVWVIPAERYKTGVDHTVPLSSVVKEILISRKATSERGYVLAGRKEGQPFAGQSSLMRRLRDKEGFKQDFTLHDLRRTCRTRLSRLGIDGETAEAVLGHARAGIQKVYDRYDRLDEKRIALQRWADHVAAIAGSRGDNVVPLRGQA